ncbi:pilus assembly protein PilP [uncultured Desulfobulbus sp.]|uniref:pilus assembly protein PilP n=1 Tax=uncultured Desulfobulbus sp. TaxID=239745 RepID=UPI0029C685AF|nr:pilus assembly protein PilP [uncultured Desulfobulbus sp.]
MDKAGIYKCLFFSITFTLVTTYSFSQEVKPQPADKNSLQLNGDIYSYNAEGRFDPFKPFVAPKSSSPTQQDPNEIIDDGNELNGMQLFEPGQLTLVGVMLSSREPIALVEDQTRKGYVLKLGNLIGKRGVVSSIDPRQVVVTETARTRSGKEMKSTTTMRIKKEGDK